MLTRYPTLILVLILTILSSCKKEGALQPLLPGQWKSTNHIEISFNDGDFTVKYDYRALGGSYAIYSGTYTLKGNDIYLSARRLEWFERTYMNEPKIMIYEKPLLEQYKFWIRDGKLQFDPISASSHNVMIDTKAVYEMGN